jgi:hypothetical protein
MWRDIARGRAPRGGIDDGLLGESVGSYDRDE